ncbi:manganase accumulation protein MntS [Raoultella planticola]|nr:manganase accumulation protein MntS [Raoultella planticola]
MNEFKRCLRVFTHSPFKVRLMLINMLCDMMNGKNRRKTPSLNAASRYAASFFRHNTLSN